MALLNFTGRGSYRELDIVKSTFEHAGYLQHVLRSTDLRECIIGGASAWRALHVPLTIKDAETFTVLSNGTPISMFGTVPIAFESKGSLATVWLLGSYDMNKHQNTWLRLTHTVFDYFNSKYDVLENVVPIDHEDTIKWLTFAGCMFSSNPTMVNGYAVLRFVRCASHVDLSFQDNEWPISN